MLRVWTSLPMVLGIGLGACDWTSDGPGARVPARLAFSAQPTLSEAGAPLTPGVTVEVRDAFGFIVANATNPVTVMIGTNPNGGTLAGATSVAAVHGVATFANLWIDKTGTGYTLAATASRLASTTSTPFEIRRTFVIVSAGDNHTCAVTVAGAAYCWGDNSTGQLGDSTTTERHRPVVVSGGLTFATVSAGSNHTCGLTKAGTAYCWGWDRYGQLGVQIYDGDSCGSFDPCSTQPVAVSSGITFTALSAGKDHTCGVTASGAAYCWGANDAGQLGDGTFTLRAAPAAVSGGLSFTAVSAGGTHTCGITTGGAAYCWGDNSLGQLGAGATGPQLNPTAIAGGLLFTSMAAGDHQTCGVTTVGAVYCWGDNAYGELGNGETSASTPIAVAGTFTFGAVSAALLHTCGVTTGGVGYCWGANGSGQLGDGFGFGPEICGPSSDVPFAMGCSRAPLPVSGGLSFASVSAGGNHVCGVSSAGARWLYCWGDNTFGELGDSTTVTRLIPTRVAQ
ncbi:MAG TPA: hypothetical protein VLT79_06685 [Gemmatimonadales bacterium]|nr:hypothetical protein [Gemmatimonadales bacterium]